LASELRYGVFKNVKLAPVTSLRPIMKGGIAFPDSLPQFCRHWARGKPIDVGVDGSIQSFPALVSENDKPFVYGGIITYHFGHFIKEFVHRLWVLDREDYRDCTVLFVQRETPEKLQPLFYDLMDFFGVKNWKIIETPCTVERLVIAEQGTMLACAEHKKYKVELQKINQRHALYKPNFPEKISILRGHLPKGKILGESALETYLIEHGYHPFRPENHSLLEQLQAITSAKKIIITDGSACHLFDVLAQCDCEIAYLYRRSNSFLEKTSIRGKVKSLASFKAVSPVMIPYRDDGTRSTSGALAYADMSEIISFLQTKGFLEPNSTPAINIDYYAEVAKFAGEQMKSNNKPENADDFLVELMCQQIHVSTQKLLTLRKREKMRWANRIRRMIKRLKS